MPILCLVFLLQTAAFLPFWPKDRRSSIFTEDTLDPSGTQGINTLLFIASGFIALMFLLFEFRRSTTSESPARLVTRHPEFVLIVAWVFSSALWAEVPMVTVRKAFGLTLTLLIALLTRELFGPRRFLSMVHAGLLLAALCSLAAATVWPTYGTLTTETSHRVWQGVFTGKNVLAMHSGLLASSSFGLFLIGRRAHRLVAAPSLVLALFLMIKAESVGAFAALGASLLVGSLLGIELIRGRSSVRLRSMAAVAAVSTIAIFALAGGSGAGAFGKSSNLTGRTDLWASLLGALRERWLFGYGYQSFWIGSGRVASVYRDSGVQLGSAHNGYLDVSLSLGVVGLILTVVLIGRGLVRPTTNSPVDVAVVVLAINIAIVNLSESRLLLPNSIFTTILVGFAFIEPVNRKLARGVATHYPERDNLTPAELVQR